jgi:hypothetical protein
MRHIDSQQFIDVGCYLRFDKSVISCAVKQPTQSKRDDRRAENV